MKKSYYWLLSVMALTVGGNLQMAHANVSNGKENTVCAKNLTQESSVMEKFGAVKNYFADEFDVKFNLPQGFNVAEVGNGRHYSNMQPGNLRGYCGTRTIASAVSEDARCKILFPALAALEQSPLSVSDLDSWAENSFRRELNTAVNNGIPRGERMKPFESAWMKYVEKADAQTAKAYNADMVFVVDYPISVAYEAKYTHCIGIYMQKKNHIPAYLKLLLTDEGYAKKDEYMKRLGGVVEYGNRQVQYDFEHMAADFNKKVMSHITKPAVLKEADNNDKGFSFMVK